MPSRNPEPYRVVNLFDWTGGVRDKRLNPLVYPENALMSGENVDLVNGGLRTRRGCSTALVSSLRAAEVGLFASGPVGDDHNFYGHTAIYDPVRHAMVVFGGVAAGHYVATLFSYDIDAALWETLTPAGGPPSARAYHSAVYDPVRHCMWVFGGYNGSDELDDLWKYDLAANTWQQASPAGNIASARQQHTAVFDPVSRCMYVFGGKSGDTAYNDLWKYDVEANQGIMASPSGDLPAERYAHTAVYEPDLGTMLVFGGYVPFIFGPVADLWTYDMAADHWTETRPMAGGTSPHPPAVYRHVAAYYPPLRSMLIHGGIYAGINENEGPEGTNVWWYDAGADSFSHITLVAAGLQQVFRCHTAMYDDGCQGVIVLGGVAVGGKQLWGFGVGGSCSYANRGELLGEFSNLAQVRFPTNESSYLLAQLEYGDVNRLYAANARLPVSGGSGTFEEIYDLNPGAGTTSITVLNDRAVITEGMNNPPLVFAGCMEASGEDWAVPKAALITQNNGESWHDITPQVCDRDPETYADLSSLPAMSGQLLVCTDMSGVGGFFFEMESFNNQAGGMLVQGYSGQWSSGAGWMDGTFGLAANGTVVHNGGVFSADYHVVNNVPGYWFSFSWPSGTNAATRVRRILFQAPCQPLQVIGEGQPDTPLGFLFWDDSENSAKDFTVEVSDFTYPSFARLNDGQLESPVGMSAADALYVGYLTPFNSVDVTPHNDYHNDAASLMSGYYWNGIGWEGLPGFADGTQNPAGTTLGMKGRVSWTTPSAWRQCKPIGPEYSHGYWVKLVVSAPLAAKTYISEVRIWPVLEPLKKHKFAMTVRDRLVLVNRPDAPDQADISRAYEEYGFAGTDSASQRIGGQDAVVAAQTVFNQGFIAKTEDWYLFNGYNPDTFSFERAEAAGQTPINNQVVVRAPLTEADAKNLMGLYYLNRTGAWYFAGIKVYKISEDVSWWDDSRSVPRIDLAHVHEACGVYWPERNWVIWAVPMTVDGAEQAFNNRLIIYDLALRAWLPPFTLSLASLTTAYHYNEHAPGKLGQLGLYGGTYNGRIVRLFGPDDTTDLGDPIAAWAETGWLHFGSPQWHKIIRRLQLYGRASAGRSISVSIWTDGNSDAAKPSRIVSLADLDSLAGQLFGLEEENVNTQGRFFKFRFEFTDVTDVFGLQLGVSLIREWGAT